VDISDIKAVAAKLKDPRLSDAKDTELISALQARGFLAHKPVPPSKPAEFDLERIRGKRVRFGIVSDTHFGSKFQQPTLLREHLRYMKKRKVDAILMPGDVFDGAVSMHAGFVYETFLHGSDAQLDYGSEVLIPEADRLGVPWYLINGNHDFSLFREGGTDIVARLCERSKWFNYLSPETDGNAMGSVGYVKFGQLLVQLCHPHLGSTRTRSYRVERWIEELSPEAKPHVVIMGNFHKVLQLDYRNVFALMVPSFQAQSTWMASKGIASYVGSAILEMGVEPRGMAPSINVEWLIERVPNQGDWPGGKK